MARGFGTGLVHGVILGGAALALLSLVAPQPQDAAPADAAQTGPAASGGNAGIAPERPDATPDMVSPAAEGAGQPVDTDPRDERNVSPPEDAPAPAAELVPGEADARAVEEPPADTAQPAGSDAERDAPLPPESDAGAAEAAKAEAGTEAGAGQPPDSAQPVGAAPVNLRPGPAATASGLPETRPIPFGGYKAPRLELDPPGEAHEAADTPPAGAGP